MKNYISKAGIKEEEIIYTTLKGSKIRISNVGIDIADAETLVSAPGCSPVGAKGRVEISKMQGLQEIINTAKNTAGIKFEKKYPNMDTLLSIINNHHDADAKFEKMMESGDSILRGNRPKITITEAKEKYPEEAAYMSILRLADADPSSEIGYIRRQAGSTAIKLLHNNAPAIIALKKATEEIAQKTKTEEYKAHCVSL